MFKKFKRSDVWFFGGSVAMVITIICMIKGGHEEVHESIMRAFKRGDSSFPVHAVDHNGNDCTVEFPL